MSFISAYSTPLMKQATMTANSYLLDAVNYIDRMLGDGYAKAHPELLAAFMQTAAVDFAGATYIGSKQEARDQVQHWVRMGRLRTVNSQQEIAAEAIR